MKLNIIIAGGGLSGLGAAIGLRRKGYNVTVLESAAKLAEVGAGIQIPPNSSRILQEYGVLDEIAKYAVLPASIKIRRYATSELLDETPLHPHLTEKYGHKYLLIHRADYQRVLCQYAEKLGVHIRLNSLVESVDPDGPSVRLVGGEELRSDIVVGADGIKSRTRASILGDDDLEPVDSPDCAYRAVIPREAMLADPETAALMDDTSCNCWIGQQGHIMAYPIHGGQVYNVVMPHPGRATIGRWNEPGDLDEMKQNYHNYDVVVRRLLDKIDACLKWKLAEMPPLPRWLSTSGRVVLIGDAAHATVPYLAQGAAMAIEDGAALAELLSLAADEDMIPVVLKAFEDFRKPRCEVIQSVSRGRGDTWHLPDGPEQEERDMNMGQELKSRATGGTGAKGPAKGAKGPAKGAKGPAKGATGGASSNHWSDGNFQPWLFGYDTVGEARSFFKKRMSPSL